MAIIKSLRRAAWEEKFGRSKIQNHAGRGWGGRGRGMSNAEEGKGEREEMGEREGECQVEGEEEKGK